MDDGGGRVREIMYELADFVSHIYCFSYFP